MSRTHVSPSAGSTIVDKLKIYEGGTGATSAAEAATALDAIPTSQIGVPGGIAGLDASGKASAAALPVAGVSLIAVSGPASVVIGQSQNYEITNYDVFTEYNLVALRGSIYRVGNTITYTAPAAIGDGTGGFTINGRTVNLTIDSIRPVAPVLVGSPNGGTNTAPTVVGTTSAFSLNAAAAYTHLNTDWQVATDSAFTNIVAQSMADAVNKLSWAASSGLSLSTTYYMRCRYRDSNNGVSDWSNTATIAIPATYAVSKEETRLRLTSPAANDAFGARVAISETGNRVAITQNGNTRKLYIFVRTGSLWNLEQTITEAGDAWFAGYGLAMSGAGDVIVTCGLGNLYTYTRSGSTWTKGTPVTVNTSSFYFQTCVISGDGARVAATVADQLSGTYDGYVRVYTRTGGVLTQQYTISSPSGSSQWFGYGLSISYDGGYIACQSANGDGAGYVYLYGATSPQAGFYGGQMVTNNDMIAISGTGDRLVYMEQNAASSYRRLKVYKRTGTTWAVEQTLSAANAGLSACINKNGDQIIAYDSGVVKVFTRSGVTWTQVATLTASTTATNNNAGWPGRTEISGDGSRAIIGASGALSQNFAQAGAAYIYTS